MKKEEKGGEEEEGKGDGKREKDLRAGTKKGCLVSFSLFATFLFQRAPRSAPLLAQGGWGESEGGRSKGRAPGLS